MKKIVLILILIMFTVYGCSGACKKKPELENGLTAEEVIQSWGEPTQKIALGVTRNNFPVQVWEYRQKRCKKKIYSLIFVDEELYSWAVDDHAAIMNTLHKLGVVKEEKTDFGIQQYHQWLNSIAEEAQKTKRTMDTINSYQNYQNTQMQIQHQQQMRILRQQQIPPPPIPPRQPKKN
ncbi:MAG: hypothetical protein GY853_11710 [PVC group bacterium]|nr:hypothetical protein [PVC group bacterium]